MSGIALAWLAMGPPVARAQEGSLEQRLDQQERELTELRGQLEGGAWGMRSGYDGKFFWETPDGAQRFTIGGIFQMHGDFYERDLEGRASEFDVRRMRFELGGRFNRRFEFNVEPNFTAGEVELEEAWVGATLGDDGPLLLFGRMKEPFMLEEMSSRKGVEFVNFSTLNQFVPAEDHGITVLGKTPAERFEYGLAYYNGSGGRDLNSDKDVAARLVVHPWAQSPDARLSGLQFGGAITFGDADADVGGEELKTEAKAPFLRFEPGSFLNGERVRLGAELAWFRGPFGIRAEAIEIREEVAGPLGAATNSTDGWYAQATYILTGEEKSFRPVNPARPFVSADGSRAGPGAFELAARYSQLDLDRDLVRTGLVQAAAFPGKVPSLDFGVNWYPMANSVVKLHWLHTIYDKDILIDGQSRGSEDALLLQLQFHF
jgi:phosphate-selective porin OprO/OprP